MVKVTIMDMIETKSVMSPNINLEGNDSRKSSSAQREVKIDKNTSIEVEEENNAIASDTANIMKDFFLNKTGMPVS